MFWVTHVVLLSIFPCIMNITNSGYRLQDETARIEDELLKPQALESLLRCFVSAKANSFENLLDPFLKITRLSTPITVGVAKSQFFKRLVDKMGHSKAVVRLNLLRLLRTVCDVHPNRAILVEKFGLYDIVVKLSKEDGAVLVRELAREITPALAPALKPLSSRMGGGSRADASKSAIAVKKKMRRTASESQAGVPVPLGSSYLGSSHIGSSHFGSSQMGSSQMGSSQVGSLHMGSSHLRSTTSRNSPLNGRTPLRHNLKEIPWQPSTERR